MAKDDITRLDLRFTNAASPPSRVASDISATFVGSDSEYAILRVAALVAS